MKKTFKIFSALVVSVALGLWVSAFISVVNSPDLDHSLRLGNWPENINRVNAADKPGPYAFVVMGDSKHGTEILEVLLEKSELYGKPSFGIHLGDFVPHSTPAQYAFFIHEFAESPVFQLFMTPGNHDVNPDEPIGDGLFERTLGPRQFWFKKNNDLFIILDNAVTETEALLPWLEEVLASQAPPSRRIFIFSHKPPFYIDEQSEQKQIEVDKGFHELMKRWRVNHVYSGHYHSYIRTEFDGVSYVVTGGAGSELYGKRGLYHALVVDVGEDQVQESLIAKPYELGIDDEVALASYEVFYDLYKSSAPTFFLIMGLGFLVFFTSWLWIVRSLVRKKNIG